MLSTLSPYFSQAIWIIPAVIVVSTSRPFFTVNAVSTVTNAGQEFATDRSTLTALPARFSALIFKLLSKFS